MRCMLPVVFSALCVLCDTRLSYAKGRLLLFELITYVAAIVFFIKSDLVNDLI